MDLDQMRAVVAAIPKGSWMSYGDVARAAGGTDQHARALNQRFIREQTPGSHRVLKSDGTVGGTALGDPVGGAPPAREGGSRVRGRPGRPGGACASGGGRGGLTPGPRRARLARRVSGGVLRRRPTAAG